VSAEKRYQRSIEDMGKFTTTPVEKGQYRGRSERKRKTSGNLKGGKDPHQGTPLADKRNGQTPSMEPKNTILRSFKEKDRVGMWYLSNRGNKKGG